MTIRVFEAFAGVGSQRMALRNLGIDHEVVAISDVDEFTINSYAAIHDNDKTVLEVSDEEMQGYLEKRNIPLNDKGVRKNLKGKKLKEFYDACVKSNNLGDISKVETHNIPDHDLFTYSFPCQDISVAGKGSGLDEGSDTRSGLLWECQKVIYCKRPKYLLLENVKNLVGKKHKHNFDKWLVWLEKQGYTNYWQVLNAKDYGVPQNRERVFVVSILGHHEPYEFPEPIELELRLKDVLEDEVDEKFYLDDEKTQQLVTTVSEDHSENTVVKMNRHEVKGENQLANTLLARYYKGFGNQDMNGVIEPRAKRIGGIFDKDGTKHQAGAVWDKGQISPALDTMQGGWRQPSIITHNYTEQVKVRKHEVDIDALKDLLRSHKQSSGKTNREISELIDEPMTLVEHWFRNDSSFAIPKEDKWLQLKEILSISTDSFDKQIMEFEIRDGVFDQANRAYDGNGISPTITATDGDKKVLTRNEVVPEVIGVVVDNPEGIPIKNATKEGYINAYDGDGVDLAYPTSKTRRGRVQKGLSQTLDTSDSKGVVIGASRGRNPENPSDRTVGSPTEQRLEINKQGTSNTITTVQKDNYVVEGIDVHPFSKKMEFRGYGQKEISPCLLATDYKAPKTILESQTNSLRIRKLTPKECWRLMGFSDDDYHKAEEVNSNSQLYKQAGNSIVVDVLEGIFKQLLEVAE